ncbi:MAG: thiamine phosphate synthase [Chitinophagales bacterium]|nr:thiamine phosphate synthase [Chitinophagales bacterium]
MKLIIYSIPYEISNEAKKINALFENGMEEFHLRKPGYTKLQYTNLLNRIDAQHHSKLVLHDFFSLAKRFKVKGVHVDSKAFDGFFGRLYFKSLKRNSDLQITTSVNSFKELKRLPSFFSAAMLGPVFTKFSESNIKENFDFFELRKLVKESNFPIYAMGGIDLNTKKNVERIGFHGVVLQSSIWKSDDIFNAFNAFYIDRGFDIQDDREFRIA